MSKDTELLLGTTEIPAEIEEHESLVIPIQAVPMQVVGFFPQQQCTV